LLLDFFLAGIIDIMVVVRWCLGVYKVRFNHKFVYNCCWSVSG
jgi:hypothetical protein